MENIAQKLLKLFGSNVRTVRKQRGISLETMSNDVDFSIELIYRIEKGEYRLRLEHIRRLSVYLGEHPADMLRKKY